MHDDGFYADTYAMRAHASEVDSAYRLARRLADHVSMAKSYAEQQGDYRYRALVDRANRIGDYLRRLEDMIEESAAEIDRFSREAGRMLDDQREELKRLAKYFNITV